MFVSSDTAIRGFATPRGWATFHLYSLRWAKTLACRFGPAKVCNSSCCILSMLALCTTKIAQYTDLRLFHECQARAPCSVERVFLATYAAMLATIC